MKKPRTHKVSTSFNTVLGLINPTEGVFEIKENATYPIDTPLQDVKGTTKTYMKGANVRGTLWMEVDPHKGKQRKVVMVGDENGRYLIPAVNLIPRTQAEVDAKSELQEISGKVEELLAKAQSEAKEVVKDSSTFLDKKYAGFTGKQILVGAVGVVVLIKLFK